MYTHSCRCILWQFEGCKKHRATWCKGFCRKHFNAHGTKEGDVPLKGKKRKTEKPLKRETEISLCTTVEDLWCLWETAKFFSPPQRVAFITQLNNFAKDRYAFELKRHTRLTEEYASQRAILQQEYFAVAKDCSNQQTPERMAYCHRLQEGIRLLQQRVVASMAQQQKTMAEFSGSQIKPSSSAHEVNVARSLILRKSQQQ
jgi:hypothetical protein